MVLALDRELRVRRQQIARLGDARRAGIDQPGHDERLPPGAGFHQAKLHEHEVGALFCHGPA